ncbi:MAG: DUF1653 domain-containing protein [Lachnospiraceae bacterium]|nr:DUF1653 domain-containing protein [Lachnospiraceae bacterium]
MSYVPRPQEIYKHFKGNLYQIITVAEHSETGEKLVIYQALYGDFKIYARELGMFTSKVDRSKYPNAAQEYRFELQNLQASQPAPQSVQASQWSTQASQPVPQAIQTSQPALQAAQANQWSVQNAQADRQATQAARANQPASASFMDEVTEAEANLDPLILEFLDADDYEAKLNVLAALHHRITDDMITIMAVASDVEVEEGDLEDRYSQLRNCLLTLEKYESSRMR